jgi:HAT1-interacting factor 1
MSQDTENIAAPAPAEGDAPKGDAAQLTKLTNEASLQYSLKNYNEAAELYSTATELQSELSGEMALENAELLFLYGRCLYKVAVSKSDVLGGQLATEKPKGQAETSQAPKSATDKLAEDVVEAAVEAKDTPRTAGKPQAPAIANKPYFEITGDENWDTDSDDEEKGDAQAEAVEEEDDLANAYEILDIARVLLIKQIAALQDLDQNGAVEGTGKGKATGELSPELRHFKERLADTHDLQAEISLENERFDDAIVDTRSALTLWQELYPKEAGIVAEGHFKLSLALEFASNVGLSKEEAEEGAEDTPKRSPEESEKLKEESIAEMEAAIESCRLRIGKEEKELTSLEGDKAKAQVKSIEDVKSIVEEMEQRVSFLFRLSCFIILTCSSLLNSRIQPCPSPIQWLACWLTCWENPRHSQKPGLRKHLRMLMIYLAS